MRRLKTYMRSTMTEARFSDLALLSCQRGFKLDFKAAASEFLNTPVAKAGTKGSGGQ